MILVPSVPNLPKGRAAAEAIDSIITVTVVLPLVPVTPMTSSCRLGSPKTKDAAGPNARRVSDTLICGRATGTKSSTTSAAAPRWAASPT